jgi:hypothetical protein
LFRASSAVAVWRCRKRRRCWICVARRSVGVGEVGLGFETGEVELGFGVVGATGKGE